MRPQVGDRVSALSALEERVRERLCRSRGSVSGSFQGWSMLLTRGTLRTC